MVVFLRRRKKDGRSIATTAVRILAVVTMTTMVLMLVPVLGEYCVKYTFPTFEPNANKAYATHWIHSLCVTNTDDTTGVGGGVGARASKAGRCYTTRAEPFVNGVQLWPPMPLQATGIDGNGNGNTLCEGGTLISSQDMNTNDGNGIVELVAVPTSGETAVTICAFVEGNDPPQNVGRDGGWSVTLPEAGFLYTSKFGTTSLGQPGSLIAHMYCKTVAAQEYEDCTIPTNTGLSCPAPPSPPLPSYPPTNPPSTNPLPPSSPYECGTDASSYQTRPIDPYELKNVGIIDPTNPLAPPPIQILGLDSLIGQSFFEVHTDQLLVDEDGNTNVIVEFYAGVDRDNPTMDCSIDGTLIASDKVQYTSDIISLGRFGYNDQFKPKNSNECFPRTKTGVVGAVEFSFTNPFYTEPADQIIWKPDGGGGSSTGTVDVCIRVLYKEPGGTNVDNNDDVIISYFDRKIFLDVNLEAGFDFQQQVEIYSEQLQGYEAEIEFGIDVVTFLCGDPNNSNDGKPYNENFGVGQAFRICVEIDDDDDGEDDQKETNFKLKQFGEVICKNTNTNNVNQQQQRVIINADGQSDLITNIFTGSDVEGSKSYNGNKIASANAIAFETTVTTSYLTRNPTDDETGSLICSGEVEVESRSKSVRRRVEWNGLGIQQQRRRQQEESIIVTRISEEEADVAAQFATSIKLIVDSAAATATTGTGSRLHYYGVILIVSAALSLGELMRSLR